MRTTQPKTRGLLTTASLLVAMLLCAGALHSLVAQTRAPARPRVQTAPTRERIIQIQEALVREGFYTARPSGRWDAATSESMKRFQTANGLTATGKLGALSLQKLGLGSEIAGKSAPLPQVNARPSVVGEAALEEPDPDNPDAPEADPQIP